MSRRSLLALIAIASVGLVLPGGRARAQVINNGGVDPFSLYYGYYLPHQAALAAQPTPLDTINQITAQRQYAAVTDRAGLYDPVSPYGGDEELDPLRPYSPKRGGERIARPYSYSASSATNSSGTGPRMYYNRTAQYHPNVRSGRGANRNLATVRSGRGGGNFGGGGMPGMGPR